MANTEQAAIICNLEELTDYQTATMRLFAANLSVGLEGTAKPASPAAVALLQPWLWSITGMQLFFQTNAADPADLTPAHTGALSVPLLAPPPLSTDAGQQAALVKALGTRLGKEYSDTFAVSTAASPLFQWQPANPGGIADALPAGSRIHQPWPHVLAHASTFPAPLPQALNLVCFFEVPVAALSTAIRLQAAPVFSLTPAGGPVLTFTTAGATPVAPPPANPASTAPQQGFSWAYAKPVGDTSGCGVAIHQPGLALQPVSLTAAGVATAGDSMWLQPVFEEGNEDWRTTLELRIAEAFDLGQSVIRALRDPYPGQPTPTDPQPVILPTESLVFGPVTNGNRAGLLEQLRVAVLSLLRDTADYGVRRAPDGASTFRYVMQRIVDADEQQTPSQLPPGFDIEAWIAAAETGPLAQTVNLPAWSAALTATIQPAPYVLTSIAPMTPVATDGTTFGRLVSALSDLQKTIAEDATIAQLLFHGWNLALSTNPATEAIWTSTTQGTAFSALVQKQLNDLAATAGLRKRMLLANLGGADDSLKVWSAVLANHIGAADEIGQIAQNLTDVLSASLNARLGVATVPPLDFSARTPAVLSGNLSPNVLGFLNARLGEQAAQAQAMLPAKATGASPSPSVHPAVLRIPVATKDKAAEDPLREIAGTCLLLREVVQPLATAPQRPWSCPNTAALNLLDDKGNVLVDATNTPLLAGNVVFVPHRLSTRNNLQQMAIAYDNRPLAAPSPLADLAAQFAPDEAPGYAPFFQYCGRNLANPAADPLAPWGRLAGLKYGSSYQAAAFLVRNSGALPPPIAAAGMPLLPVPPAAFPGPPPTAISPPFVYRRRTPVAKVRFYDSKQNGNLNLPSLPVIPETVLPLARDSALLTPTANEQTATTPLLLLWDSAAPATGSYTFAVRPPGADIHVWDRWVAGRPDAATLRGTRAAVYGDFTLNAPKNTSDTKLTPSTAQAAVDISLNDPAVTFLCFTLTPVMNATASAATAPKCIAVPGLSPLDATSLAPGQGFAQVQAFSTQAASQAPAVTIRKGAAASLTVTSTTVTVEVPAGEVWQLSMAPSIDPNLANYFDQVATGQSFSSSAAFTDAQGNKQTLAVPDNPVNLLIEYAAPISLTAQTLWQAIGFEVPGATGTELKMWLTPSIAGEWHLLRRVQIARQAWRWMGRPVEVDLPSADPAQLALLTAAGQPDNALATALNWELQAFAEREDTASTRDCHVGFGFVAPGAAAPRQILYREDLATDLRAHYFRFGATFYSRYEGLDPTFQPFTTTSASSLTAKAIFPGNGKADGYTTWTRALVPCRLAAGTVLPKPKILLCLPLTSPASDGGAAHTSILVIADEPWYQIAGLSESLVAQIDEVTQYPDPDPATGQTILLPEIGADPILAPLNVPPLPVVSPAGWTGIPIGTTFDDASTAPLLAHTCFQFSLDALTGGSTTPLDWYMARLRFVRTIGDRAISYPANATPASAPTEGVWVQFLPSSSHFSLDNGELRDITKGTATLDAVHQKLQMRDANGASIQLKPGPQANPVTGLLQLWALLMRDITDAAGQAGEAYAGLYNLTTAPAIASLNGASHLYLLEIQISPVYTGTGTGNWLDMLFPNAGTSNAPIDATQDVTHRILRTSPKVKIE